PRRAERDRDDHERDRRDRLGLRAQILARGALRDQQPEQRERAHDRRRDRDREPHPIRGLQPAAAAATSSSRSWPQNSSGPAGSWTAKLGTPNTPAARAASVSPMSACFAAGSFARAASAGSIIASTASSLTSRS